MLATEDIKVEHRQGVAVARIDRPQVLNAFRKQTIDDLFGVLEALASDESVKAIVLTGTGRAFSSGQDLREIEQRLKDGWPPEEIRSELDRLQQLTKLILSYPKPTIAALNGVAVGLGAELPLVCDLRLASVSASIGFVEARRGLFQTNGVMYFLPRLVGYGHAAELLLTGERISADTALRIGLVSRVYPDGELLHRAVELSRTIASNAPISVRLIKQGLQQTFDVELDAMLAIEVNGMLTCLDSQDLREGTLAFVERRPAAYTGN